MSSRSHVRASHLAWVGLGCLLLNASSGTSIWAAAMDKTPQYDWQLKEGHSLAFLAKGRALWTLNFRKDEGKPYFHPVCLSDRTVLTWLRPADHRWHRAIWFSWKYINKVNYWEENRQGISPGRTEIADVRIERGKDGTTRVVMQLDYRPAGKPVLLKERRELTITPPDEKGCYRIDWHMVSTAQDQDVHFDRTKTKAEGGPAWGGYAGLSYRAAKGMTAYKTLDSEGRRNMAGHGQHARWLDFSGIVDRTASKAAGVAIFDHPGNPRHPTPWYIIMSGHFGYVGPAFLFDRGYILPKRKSLVLKYRMLVHPGRGTKNELERECQAFSGAAAVK